MTSREPTSQAGIDFAKQLLILIGTLVTAVASFYFGSKAVADAHASVAGISGPPSLIGSTPSTIIRGGARPTSLAITGSSLNDVKQAHLESGGNRINGTEVVSNADKVQACFLIDNKVAIGAWTVVVTDAAGRSARLDNGLTVSALQLKGVNPNSVSRSGNAVFLTITGVNLGGVTEAHIESGSNRINGTDLKVTPTEVRVTFVVDMQAATGKWNVVVADGAGRVERLSDGLTVS